MDSDTLFFAKLPDLRVLQIMSRSLFVVIILMILPYFGPVRRGSHDATPSYWATYDARKQALKGLEDALMEPPRKGTMLTAEMRKFNFLPDLLVESLEGYDRRILISDDKNGVFEEWFYRNYPTRYQIFEIINLKADEERYGGSGKSASSSSSWASDWIKTIVRQQDFVVMKAQAELVDEMIKEKTIHLVDELFLECDLSKRAYWQCLALYGRLKEQGIAVHQWWN